MEFNQIKTDNHKGLPQRRSIRLQGYDYTQAGLYFLTICTQNRACLFGEIVGGKMILNDAGHMVVNEWTQLPHRFTNIRLHEYVAMPNHFHAILEIVGATLVVAPNDQTIAPNDQTIAPNDDHNQKNEVPQNEEVARKNHDPKTNNGQPQGVDPTVAPTAKTVGDMMAAFKSITTVKYIHGVKSSHWPPFDGKLWQRNYWEHIIRSENEYQRIGQYIMDNPKKWKNDQLNHGKGNKVLEPEMPYNQEPWMV